MFNFDTSRDCLHVPTIVTVDGKTVATHLPYGSAFELYSERFANYLHCNADCSVASSLQETGEMLKDIPQH